MTGRRAAAVVLALLVASVAVPAATGAAAPVEPRFEAYVPQPTLTPGQPNQLAVQVVNDADDPGDTARTAGSVEVSLSAEDTPLTVRSGTTALGSVPDGRPVSTTFGLDVPYDVKAGTYDLEIAIEYTDEGDRETVTRTVPVEVPERPLFVVTDVDADVAVDDSGTVAVTVENVGSEVARDATVTLQSTSTQVALGGAASASRFGGTIEPGGTATLSFDVAVAQGAAEQSFALRTTVEYTDSGGTPGRSRALSIGLTPGPEQQFAVEDAGSTLQVGEEGELRGTLRNTGEAPARDVVVLLRSDSPGVSPREFEVPLGDLEDGEAAPFSFAIDISEDAVAGPERFSLVVEYRTADDERRRTEPDDVRVTVAESVDDFALAGIATSVTAGATDTLRLEVTNRREEAVEDVTAKLFADDPVSAEDDEAFVGTLEPGSSATLTFSVAASGDALTKAYPVQVDFQYRTPDGDTRLSDTYTVAVDVESQSGGEVPLPILAGAGILLVAVLGGILFVLSRRG